jgi:redox-sensitive bicupin YhaK (pirin superfamily)
MPLQLVLDGHAKDLGGGFVVRRLLPAARRQAVGPFLFFDHFGPVDVVPEAEHDVRPHPHIGLATVTYLFEGCITHRDSLGCVQDIEPGAINWMTAGRGIVHSERRPADRATRAYVNHGFQLWAALPAEHEEAEPAFVHTPAADIPQMQLPGCKLRLLIGEAFGTRSPVATLSPTLYLDLKFDAGSTLELPSLAEEMALYPVDAAVQVDGQGLGERHLGLLAPGRAARIEAPQGGRVLVLGGAPLGHRFMWWNFVSSRKERIVQAAQDWKGHAFANVPGETERIELPNLALPT